MSQRLLPSGGRGVVLTREGFPQEGELTYEIAWFLRPGDEVFF